MKPMNDWATMNDLGAGEGSRALRSVAREADACLLPPKSREADDDYDDDDDGEDDEDDDAMK